MTAAENADAATTQSAPFRFTSGGGGGVFPMCRSGARTTILI